MTPQDDAISVASSHVSHIIFKSSRDGINAGRACTSGLCALILHGMGGYGKKWNGPFTDLEQSNSHALNFREFLPPALGEEVMFSVPCVCLCVCLSGFVGPTLCTTAAVTRSTVFLVHDYC